MAYVSLLLFLQFDRNMQKVQKSMPMPISKPTLIDTFLTSEKGMNYWMLPGKSSSRRAEMPWADDIFAYLTTLLDGLLLNCLYDALPTLLRITVYFVHALCLLFVLFKLSVCHAIETMSSRA